MNPKLQAIAHKAAQDLIASITEGEEKILEAWHAAEEEAQNQETGAKFKLGFAITLDLEANALESKLSFGMKRSLSIVSEIPDPSQIDLPIADEDKVTIKTEGVEATLTQEQARKAFRHLSKN